jgi:hypothetical protein
MVVRQGVMMKETCGPYGKKKKHTQNFDENKFWKTHSVGGRKIVLVQWIC